jgi:hypothetical protein
MSQKKKISYENSDSTELLRRPSHSNFPHHLEVITVVSFDERRKTQRKEEKEKENYKPQLRKLSITIKE